MGRRIPSTTISSINPTVSLSLVAAGIIATMAILATLCAAHSRKPSIPSPSTSSKRRSRKSSTTEEEALSAETTPPPSSQTSTTEISNSKEETTPTIHQERQQQEQQLESSPKAKELPIRHFRSMSKLTSNLSMKLSGTSLSKILTRKDGQEQKQEDSLCSKTIILGEKCKVPDEEDAIIYDGKGNRIPSYPCKTPRSLPVSRTNSILDQDSLPFK